MDWSNETYVRLYVRDTTNWLKLRWQGQTLLMFLLRKLDRSGRLDGINDLVDDLSLVTGLPEEIVEEGIKRLLKMETVQINDNVLVMPNYIEAQEATKTDKQRKKESRQRRRERAMGIEKPKKKTPPKNKQDECPFGENVLVAPDDFTGRQRAFLNALMTTEFLVSGSDMPVKASTKISDPIRLARTLGDTNTYPAVEPGVIARAAAWTLANPSKRKSQLERFIVNWVSRNQEKGGDSSGLFTQRTTQRTPERDLVDRIGRTK